LLLLSVLCLWVCNVSPAQSADTEPTADQFVSLMQAEAQSLQKTKAHLQQEIARNLARQSALQKESIARSSAADLASMKLQLQQKRLSARRQHLLNEMKLSANALRELGSEDLQIDNTYSRMAQAHRRSVSHQSAPSLVEVADTPRLDRSQTKKISFATAAGRMMCSCRLDSHGSERDESESEIPSDNDFAYESSEQPPIKGAEDTSAPWIHAPKDGKIPPVFGLQCFEACQEYKCRKDFPTYGFDLFHDCVISCVERCYKGDKDAIKLAEVAFHRQEVAHKKVERELAARNIDGLL